MEHEVFVPVPPAHLRDALADPARVARAVPGLQQDAGAAPVTGRLKVRVGSHSVTYRGTVRVTAQDDGTYTAEGDASEARGTGSVKLALTLRVLDADGGSTLAVEGTASADGRVVELPAGSVAAAVTRLLDRFAENLGTTTAAEEAAPEPSVVDTEIPPPALAPAPEDEATENVATDGEVTDGEVTDEDIAQLTEDVVTEDEDVVTEDEEEEPTPIATPVTESFVDPSEPPAEAAHARRTMIGRSAEEVDHAPPRGRYAPVPAPQAISPGSSLRWAAPAAALALASAIVVTRALRKRR
ncbi:SRPBCC domain-containing protein [Streptomyces pseudovenezuelae]|uniref:Carbon monoxide dehydrogenase subunit G n=1 Tax=Streptomyces pseudovenezuelae TaxID=67350 RepID=A0ABT6LEP7_9ACTN|nr:SRPBCC domain-containing protein [Streptomyces pseudovenezuelae]MDH6214788.1 carbon monoxide dehydrogenase subunit G [Streptomyces pseudovenezuelae]